MVTLSNGDSIMLGQNFGTPYVSDIPNNIVGLQIGQNMNGGFLLTYDTCSDLQTTNYLAIGLSLGGLFIAIVAYVIVRRRMNKKNALDEQEASDQENTLLATSQDD